MKQNKSSKQFEEMAITRAKEICAENECSKRKAYFWAINELLPKYNIVKTKKELQQEKKVEKALKLEPTEYEIILKEIQKYADSHRDNNELNMYWVHVVGALEEIGRIDLAMYFCKISGINYHSQENRNELAKS
jgi:hypothetical protein